MVTLDLHRVYEERFMLVADPLPVGKGCEHGPAPADAEALALSIRSDPDLEATEPVVVSVGGIDALRMDVVAATGASLCLAVPAPQVVAAPGPNGRPWFSGAPGSWASDAPLSAHLPGGSARYWPSRSSLQTHASNTWWTPQHQSWTRSSSTPVDGDTIERDRTRGKIPTKTRDARALALAEGRRDRHERNRMMLRIGRTLALAVLGVSLGACTSGSDTTGAAATSAVATTDPSSTPTVLDLTPTIMDILAGKAEPFTDLEPGTYAIDPDLDPWTPLRVTWEIPAEGWKSWIGAGSSPMLGGCQ